MTEEQIKEKAKDFVSKIASGTPKEMDYYADILAEFATEVTKELQEQIEKLNKELEEYKNIDKRLICNHKFFTSDIKNNNLAVICHSILSCDMCGRWEEND